ncbi:glycosyltransferase [Lichenibacterium dinghuense]|uniref:glycosyltransferase n=1 Tax=Lichenibacterium dinghuense TaxID=2895977 RepID=UPI001F29914E|nr:glycosyltransferase [Lichenibacterium sp. 6Y81]
MDETADGPWRCSDDLRLCVTAEVGDLGAAAAASRLGAAFGAAGLPLAEARAVPAGGLRSFLHRSAATGVDALVLDPRTAIDPATVMALRRAADVDPMIVATLPRFAAQPSACPPAVPQLDYGLRPDRRCVYVKASALAALGDGVFTAEGDDLAGPLLALARVGFRVAVAGGAEVIHPDGAVPASPVAMPADWRPALKRRATSAPAVAEALLEGLAAGPDGRLRIAFDLSHAGPSHSGTTLLARALIDRAAARWHDLSLHVIASAPAFAFHFGGLGGAVTRVDPSERATFAALVRFGQPFLWGEIDAAVRRAPALVLFMLDTIGLDCAHDAPDELDALWRFCLAEADGLLFNSAFTARQYVRRFGPPARPSWTSLHSLDLADYRLGAPTEGRADGTVLMIGNAMPHKRLRETAAALVAAGLERGVVALGLAPGAVPGVEGIASGGLAPERVAALYAAARVVVYPSVYEGFGFPILDALAHRRPILVRDLPPYDELSAGLAQRANIHRYSDDADLIRRLADPPAWIEADSAAPARNWDDAADDLRAALDAAVRGVDRARLVRRIDLLRGRMAFMRARAFDDDVDADELDRLAGLSGRLVHGALLWLGRHVPGTRAALAFLHRGLDRLRAAGRRG